MSNPVTQRDRTVSGYPRKGRRARKTILVLGVLIAVLVGADFGFAVFAEHAVSQEARDQFQLNDDPSVSINGFPFTSQAIAGEYGHITVQAGGVPVEDTLRDVALKANLRDVIAPLSDVLSGNTDSIKIGRLNGEVELKASDIARIAPLDKIEDLSIEPSTEKYVKTGDDSADASDMTDDEQAQSEEETTSDSSAGMRLSGAVQVAGRKMHIFAFTMLELHDQTLRIVPERLQFGDDQDTTVVPKPVQDALLPDFEASIDPGDLPFAVTPTAVQVDDDALIVKGKAKNVTFSGASAAGTNGH